MRALYQLRKRLPQLTVVLVLLLVGAIFEQKIVQVLSDIPEPLSQVKTEAKTIALTINVDWGEEVLPGILEVLERQKVKATFFVTGRWAGKNPEMLKTIAAKGHELGNHGFFHKHPDKLSIAANEEEINKTELVILNLTGAKTQYYAPPYGERGRTGLKAADNLGYRTILWTLDTVDWRQDSTPEIITQRIINPKKRFGLTPSKEGAIVLMHPKINTLAALPQILVQLNKEGFRFATISELITSEKIGHTTSDR